MYFVLAEQLESYKEFYMELTAKCPKCNGQMELGVIVDQGDHGQCKVNEWSEGPPEKSFWFGLKVKNPHPIKTYRCRLCGFLESYAGRVKDTMYP
jgi:phage FluMu protein Com